LLGKVGADSLNGGEGNDALFGGDGRDALNGGLGHDQFVFDSALGTANVDSIKDFKRMDDTIQLDNAIFTSFKVMGAIAKSRLVSGANATAADANDNLIYDTDTGALSYDADGNGAGVAIQFVTLTGIPALAASHFLIV
jgi:Ca2+-binding RTX toxin-like protein